MPKTKKSIHEYKGKINKRAFLIKYRADTADKVKKGMCFLKACFFFKWSPEVCFFVLIWVLCRVYIIMRICCFGGAVEHFRSYLLSKRIVPEKRLKYYLSWITQFYAFLWQKPPPKGTNLQQFRCDRMVTVSCYTGRAWKNVGSWTRPRSTPEKSLRTRLQTGHLRLLLPTIILPADCIQAKKISKLPSS